MKDDTAYGGFLEAIVNAAPTDGKYTRRQYMVRKLVRAGEGLWNASQAVDYASANHKDWDMNEERTWEEWEQALQRGKQARDEPELEEAE